MFGPFNVFSLPLTTCKLLKRCVYLADGRKKNSACWQTAENCVKNSRGKAWWIARRWCQSLPSSLTSSLQVFFAFLDISWIRCFWRWSVLHNQRRSADGIPSVETWICWLSWYCLYTCAPVYTWFLLLSAGVTEVWVEQKGIFWIYSAKSADNYIGHHYQYLLLQFFFLQTGVLWKTKLYGHKFLVY